MVSNFDLTFTAKLVSWSVSRIWEGFSYYNLNLIDYEKQHIAFIFLTMVEGMGHEIAKTGTDKKTQPTAEYSI